MLEVESLTHGPTPGVIIATVDAEGGNFSNLTQLFSRAVARARGRASIARGLARGTGSERHDRAGATPSATRDPSNSTWRRLMAESIQQVYMANFSPAMIMRRAGADVALARAARRRREALDARPFLKLETGNPPT